MSDAVPDPATVLATYLREAITEAKLAYDFVPSSYTYGALQACLAAEQALAVLRETLEAQGGAQKSTTNVRAIRCRKVSGTTSSCWLNIKG